MLLKEVGRATPVCQSICLSVFPVTSYPFHVQWGAVSSGLEPQKTVSPMSFHLGCWLPRGSQKSEGTLRNAAWQGEKTRAIGSIVFTSSRLPCATLGYWQHLLVLQDNGVWSDYGTLTGSFWLSRLGSSVSSFHVAVMAKDAAGMVVSWSLTTGDGWLEGHHGSRLSMTKTGSVMWDCYLGITLPL